MDKLVLLKKQFGSVVTNIYPNGSIYQNAIDNGRMEAEETNGCFFALESVPGFKRVFFAAPKADLVLPALASISSDFSVPVVLEHVVREVIDKKLGSPNYILKRMSHKGELKSENGSPIKHATSIETRDAHSGDISILKNIFAKNFNPLSERIPDEDELLTLINHHGIKLAVNNGKIVGFIIFEKVGASLHLRYWWTAPDFRGMGVGSLLMQHYIEAAKDTVRQFLWVFHDNENAIKRYRHYGFEFDGTQDQIYILKN